MSNFHLAFDGAGYIKLPYSGGDLPQFDSTEITIEFIIRTPEDGTGGGCLFDAYDDTGDYGIKINIDASGRPTIQYWTAEGIYTIHETRQATGDFTAGNWYHCVFSFKHANFEYWYINGERRGEWTPGPYFGAFEISSDFYIGANWTGSEFDNYFKGDIGNFGYYVGKALSQSEVQARYQAVDFAGTEDGLSWASNMNTGSGLTTYDVMAGVDGIISSLDHVAWETSDIPFTPPYEMMMRIVPGRDNLRSILMPPFGGLGGLVPGIRVYRGQDGIIDYDDTVAFMAEDDVQVVIPDQDLPPDTTWHYIRRKVTACGLESPDSPACIVVIDSNGDMTGPTPPAPAGVSVEKVAGAKLKVRWRYSPTAQEVEPTGFNIYMDSGSGFDFGLPEAIVAYNQGGYGEFDWTSASLTDGQLYRFTVRSYRSGGGESQNTDYVSAAADSTGPDAITGLIASWQEVPG